MFALTANYGNFGVAVARLAGFGTIFFSIFVVERLFFKHIQFGFWIRILLSLGAASLVAAAVEFSVTTNLPQSWATLFLSAGIGGAAYLLVLLLLKFVTEDEKLLIRTLLKR